MKEILIVVFIVLQVLDAATTAQVLKRGGCELNKVMAKIMGLIGMYPGLILAKFATVSVILAVERVGAFDHWLGLAVLALLNIGYALVCVANRFGLWKIFRG